MSAICRLEILLFKEYYDLNNLKQQTTYKHSQHNCKQTRDEINKEKRIALYFLVQKGQGS